MTRVAARDEAALRTLYERHSGALLGLCIRIVGDRNEAEQILLDVFWEMWQRAQRYDASRSAPLTYLTLMARSRSLDCRRRKKAAPGSAGGEGAQVKPAISQNPLSGSTALAPLSHLLAGEQSQSLRDALLSLDEQERSLIEACFYDGYTHVELAEKLRQPLGTVKTRIRRGLARLRLRLQNVFDEPRPTSSKAGPIGPTIAAQMPGEAPSEGT